MSHMQQDGDKLEMSRCSEDFDSFKRRCSLVRMEGSPCMCRVSLSLEEMSRIQISDKNLDYCPDLFEHYVIFQLARYIISKKS